MLLFYIKLKTTMIVKCLINYFENLELPVDNTWLILGEYYLSTVYLSIVTYISLWVILYWSQDQQLVRIN